MKKLNSSDIILILINFIPLIGVVFFDWSVFSILIGYWAETGIVGFFIFLKVFFLLLKRPNYSSALLFFMAICNLLGSYVFMFFHLAIMATLLSDTSLADNGYSMEWLFKDAWPMWAALILSHGYSFLYNFIGQKEYAGILDKLNQPRVKVEWIANLIFVNFIPRIIYTQGILIIGMFIIGITQAHIYFLLFFVLFKIIVDLSFHRRKHQFRVV